MKERNKGVTFEATIRATLGTNDLTQPQILIDKKLYMEYRRLLKANGGNLVVHNSILFRAAVEAEVEAMKEHAKQPQNQLFSRKVGNG